MLKLAEDPVPNIRFNVAKIAEQIYGKMNNSNKLKTASALKSMAERE